MIVKKGLGKGIDALITGDNGSEKAGKVLEIDINQIEPNRDQPRKIFRQEELAELAESIRQYGIISPIIVKKENDYYSIIAGERRWRAARIAELTSVPVIVRDYDDFDTLHVALIENLQRADLNPVEEALSFRRLLDEFDLTQEAVAEKIGKSRSAVANSLRLLNLSERILGHLQEDRLSAGHAKVLLGVADDTQRDALADQIAEESLSVRETERLVAALSKGKKEKARDANLSPKPSEYVYLENELNTALGTKVNIKSGKSGDKGKIEIEFFSKEELDRIYLQLKGAY